MCLYRWLKKKLEEEDYLYVKKYGSQKAYMVSELFSWKNTPQGFDFWKNLQEEHDKESE